MISTRLCTALLAAALFLGTTAVRAIECGGSYTSDSNWKGLLVKVCCENASWWAVRFKNTYRKTIEIHYEYLNSDIRGERFGQATLEPGEEVDGYPIRYNKACGARFVFRVNRLQAQ